MLASLLFAASAQDMRQKQRQAPTFDGVAADRVIFAVFDSSSISGSAPGTFMDPMMIMSGGNFVAPPKAPDAGDRAAKMAAAAFKKGYAPGATFPLYFGGRRTGGVSVQPAGKLSCLSLAALVTMNGLPPLQTANFALAVSGDPPASHANQRRFANPAELKVALTYAQQAFAANGVHRHLLWKVEAVTVVVTDLDRDGQYEMVASYKLDAPGALYRLFIILYNNGDGTYQPLLSEYHMAVNSDLVDDKNEMFVDQLDLDGDGMDEVFTRSYYYQSWDYSMYKKGANGWKKVYSGGGGGC